MGEKTCEKKCDCCNIQFTDITELFKHEHTLFHHKNLERQSSNTKSKVNSHFCEACDIGNMVLSDFMRHIGTRSHKDALNAAIAQKLSSSSGDGKSVNSRRQTENSRESDVISTSNEVTSTEKDTFAYPSERLQRHKRRFASPDRENYSRRLPQSSSSTHSSHKTRDTNSISDKESDHRIPRDSDIDTKSRSSSRSRRYDYEDSYERRRRSPPRRHGSSSHEDERRGASPDRIPHFTDPHIEDQQDKYRTERILQQCQETVNQYRAQRAAMQAKHHPYSNPLFRHPPRNFDYLNFPHVPPFMDFTRFPPPSFNIFPPPGYRPSPQPVPDGGNDLSSPPSQPPTSSGRVSTTQTSSSSPPPSPVVTSANADASNSAKRVAPLSTTAVQRIKMGESAVGKWLQESGAGRVDNSVASDMQVQRLLSVLLSRPKPSRSISSSSHEKNAASTTAPSSSSSVTDNATTVISPPVLPQSSPREALQTRTTVNQSHQTDAPMTPQPQVPHSNLLSPTTLSIKAEPVVEGDLDEVYTNVTSLPTTERRAIADMEAEPENTTRSVPTSMPSPQAKKIRLETTSHQSASENNQNAPTPTQIVSNDNVQDAEVAALFRAIELKREENRLTEALHQQIARIAELKQQLREAEEVADKLREERRCIRQTKARLCTEVCTKSFSDEEGNEADAGPPNSAHTSENLISSRSGVSHTSAFKVDEAPLSSRSGSSQNIRSARNTPVPPLTFVNHISTTNIDTDADGEVSSTPSCSRTYSIVGSARNMDAVIPALGNETVREIIQRVMAADDEESHEAYVDNSAYFDLPQAQETMLQNATWADYQVVKTFKTEPRTDKEGTLSNVSSIADCGLSDVEATPRDGNSVISDVLSLEPFLLQNFADGTPVQMQQQQSAIKQEALSPDKLSLGAVTVSNECVNASISQDKLLADSFFPGEISAHYGSAILDVFIHEDHVYTCAQDATIKKFNLKSHQLIVTFHGHEDAVSCLSVTTRPKGIERVFTGGYDKRMLVFGGKSGRELQRLHFEDKVLCLTMAWDWAFLGFSNGEVVQFNVCKNRVTNRWSTALHEDTLGVGVNTLLCGKEGARQVLFVGSVNGQVSMRDADSGLILQALNGHPMCGGCIHSLGVLGHRLFSASNRVLCVHDFTSAASLMNWKLTEELSAMSVSRENLILAFTDGAIRVYEVQGNMPKKDNILTLYGRKRVTVTRIRLFENVIIAGTKEGDLLIMRLSDNNFRCQFGKCEDNYCSRDDLIYHIVRDHVVNCTNSTGQSIVCGWPQCSFVFHDKLGIKVIEEHVASHIH